MSTFVKQCPGCPATFALNDFMGNPELNAIGMQFEDADLEYNMYYFNHECPNCGSTLVVSVLEFLPLIEEPVPEEVLTGLEPCEGHCMRIEDLANCGAPCRYAPFRRFLLKLKSHTAAKAGPGGDQAA